MRRVVEAKAPYGAAILVVEAVKYPVNLLESAIRPKLNIQRRGVRVAYNEGGYADLIAEIAERRPIDRGDYGWGRL